MFHRSRLFTFATTAALAVTLYCSISASTPSAVNAAANNAATEGIKVTLNGNEFIPKSLPFVKNGAMYLPVRDMGELLGTLVSWNASAKSVTMNYPKLTVKLSYGSTNATVNGKTIALTAPLRIVEGRVFVPLRFFSEATGADVEWKEALQTVNITRADDFVKENAWGHIWLDRKTGELYKSRDEQSPAVHLGKLNAAIQGSVSFNEIGIGGGASVITIMDNYGEPRVQYDAYGVLIHNNKIVSQKKASYFQRYEHNASYFQVYHPNGWLQYLMLTDGKTATVFNEQGKAVKEYDLPALAGKDDVYSIHAVGEDYLVVRPNRTGLLTLIDLKDNSVVVLADKLLTGKDLEYARSNDIPYHGDELYFAGDMGHGTLNFSYNSPLDNNDSTVRLSYDRASYADERDALPKTRSISELASTCKPENVDLVYMQEGDLLYIPLVGANEEDRKSINTFCGILKKFAAKGVQETAPEVIRETFFHGMSIIFTEGDYLEMYRVPQGLAIGVGTGKRLVLDDIQAIRDYEQLKVQQPPLSIGPNPARFGETVHMTGTNGNYKDAESTVSVFWKPPMINNSTKHNEKALLIYTGTAKFGRFDFKFKMPAYGKASDGTMKPLQLGKGIISVDDSSNFELLPASKIFLSVNGVPAADPSFEPVTISGKTYVPLRAIASITGEAVAWDANTRSVLIRTKPSAVEGDLKEGAGLWIDGKKAASELQPIIRSGSAYVPIRAVTAAFGLPVAWDNVSRSVNVTVAPSTNTGK
ncbi:hypothetical protein PAECIP111893_02056 [Paenibacillus plantiphilus]|uniref:Copper amine oxidase-like N-terminal domain-containing protein n=1 Tax=Paenibacillus plantiphilus TaxID=2905650 RepID=A0ABM9C6R6_9BACL|nr:copper amine oxidase N-terminal domain-containing protein [Paenibacillus plantiphilus]CAH1203747.1 hypothetical protein PAECIP111893_02056 [Paenibacillus plantiphilus]